MFTAFNLVPAIYIVCFVLIGFASLTFKIRRVEEKEFDALRESILDEN